MKLKPALPKVDRIEFAIGRNAALGIPDSGKSYAMKIMAEMLAGRGSDGAQPLPFIAFDPTGVWPYLRVPAKGPAIPVVVAGGSHADLPLNPQKVQDLIRAAMESNISLVVDLYDPKLSKADWRRVVKGAAEVLLYENKDHGLRHIFLEEAAEFVPQRVSRETGDVYSALEKIARMGRNAGLGLTVINQRAEEVNKAVLELCDTLFLFRQRGRRSLEALDKWLGRAEIDNQKEILKSLPQLPQGECWLWLKANERPQHIKFPALNSFHPNARTLHGQGGAPTKKPVDVKSFVEQMKDKMEERATKSAKLAAPSAAPSMAMPKSLIVGAPPAVADRNLKALLADQVANHKAALAAQEADLRRQFAEALADFQPGQMAHWTQALKLASEYAEGKIAADIRRLLQKINSRKPLPQPQGSPQTAALAASGNHAEKPAPAPRAQAPALGGGESGLPKGQRAVLTAIAQHQRGCTRPQITVLTGYTKSSRNTYLQQLQQRGLIQQAGERLVATPEGIGALGDFEPLPTGAALRDLMLRTLPQGQARVLEVVIEGYPDAVPRDFITDKTGYTKSSRNTYVQQLAARELVEAVGAGVKASEDLF